MAFGTYSGIVVKGSERATALGFPTANIPLTDSKISGIYAARVDVEGREYIAAAFADPKRMVLEAYLLDFEEDLYGKPIEIVLCEKIRESESFENDKKLIEAMEGDVDAVRAYFKR